MGVIIRRRVAAALSLAVIIAITTTARESTATAAGSAFCGLSGFAASHSYVWTGVGPNSFWETATNWDLGGAPATSAPGMPFDPNGPQDLDNPSRAVDYVCIGLGPNGMPAHVTLGGTDQVGPAVAALDIGQGADLTVTENSRLWLNAPPSTGHTSAVRAGSQLTLRGATLGGASKLNVAGVLDAVSVPMFPVTITTRYCDVEGSCSSAPPTPGTTVIAGGGVFAVDGNPDDSTAGINLEDERIVDNSGTIRLANKGYVAADHGTTIKNEAGATIDIANDFGIYEGRNHFGALPALSNKGKLQKSAGAGTSALGTTYQQAKSGSVAVMSGAITLGRSLKKKGVTVPPATVSPGSTYGLGTCAAPTSSMATGCASAEVDASSPQAASVTLSTIASTSTVQVATQTTGLPGAHIGQAVQFETGTTHATTAHPDIFVMLYDGSLVPSSEPSDVTMERAEDGSSAFVAIPDCASNGKPPAGHESCVDMRGIPGVSSAGLSTGGVQMVIRTTQNSRWVGV